MRQPNVYIVPDCDRTEVTKDSYNAILNYVRDETCSKEPVIICCDTIKDEQHYTLTEFVMTLCRKHGILKNERVTLLSSMDQMVAVQLCLAEKNKQDIGDYDVESSTAIHQCNTLIKQKLSTCTPDIKLTQTVDDWLKQDYTQFLSNCNQVDMCDILQLLVTGLDKNENLKNDLQSTDIIVLGLPSHQIQKYMLKFLCNGRTINKITMETSLENNSNIQVLSVPTSLDEIQLNSTQEFIASKNLSITESYVKMVLQSYLELLVNTRSELALARVLNVPNRELTHEAFTELKREAKTKNMTMYQTAVSYILKIRLGGKGYAPDPSHPLLQFVKGLGEFVDLMHRLQNVIEEESNTRSACRKVVNIIKKELLRSTDTKLRQSSIETVSDRLQEQIKLVIDQTERNKMSSPDKSVSNGGSLLGRKTLTALRYITDKILTQQDQSQSIDYLCDGFSSQKTPIRFPSLLSQFRSPDENCDDDEENSDLSLSLSERLVKRQSGVSLEITQSYQASYDWALPAHHVGLPNKDDICQTNSPVVVLPSKTLAHPASASKAGLAKKILESIRDQENIQKIQITKTFGETCKPKSVDVVSSQLTIELSSQTSDETKGNVEKGGKKRKNTESNAPPKKKSKTETKSCRRKLLPQVKGQQQLSTFFRV
ncbi:PCNA-interacting partner-like [Mytilus trossulus]|uniref:PCNA-interacting partner-like n=1 Tax=Mytilus trossulus TaxID=6551 RepID=UPI0030051F55